MAKSRVDIKSPDWDISLHGDERFVGGAYDALRDFLAAHLEATLIPGGSENLKVPEGPGRLALEVEICHDLYRRTHLIERSSLQESGFGDRLNASELVSIYVERSAQGLFSDVLALGKPLWSVLTDAGTQAATANSIHGGSSGP